MTEPAPKAPGAWSASDPWADLVLTLPVFVGYHLGVVFLRVRNAADVVTRELVALAEHDLRAYTALTLGIGLVFVVVLGLAGRGHALRWQRFAWILGEGILYAVAMRLVASEVVGRVFLGAGAGPGGAYSGIVLSLGAGFYEEIAFRVGLFGLGLRVIRILWPPSSAFGRGAVAVVWAVAAAAAFSGWHYVGALGDAFDPHSFVFRWVCGLVFTLIYAFRGFAPAVWTHVLYDVWVMVL